MRRHVPKGDYFPISKPLFDDEEDYELGSEDEFIE